MIAACLSSGYCCVQVLLCYRETTVACVIAILTFSLNALHTVHTFSLEGELYTCACSLEKLKKLLFLHFTPLMKPFCISFGGFLLNKYRRTNLTKTVVNPIFCFFFRNTVSSIYKKIISTCINSTVIPAKYAKLRSCCYSKISRQCSEGHFHTIVCTNDPSVQGVRSFCNNNAL